MAAQDFGNIELAYNAAETGEKKQIYLLDHRGGKDDEHETCAETAVTHSFGGL